MKNLFEKESKEEVSPLLIAAHRLAILFSEERNTPLQFRVNADRHQKTNEDTQIMNKFKNKVSIWKDVISKIIEKVEHDKAWRFINLNPIIEENTKCSAYNKDCNDFTDYFVLRRDVENCDSDELGCLAQLHTRFQNIIDFELNKQIPDFVAIDIEHATRVKGTICSIGIVSFRDSEIIDKYYSLVKPPNNEYEFVNTNTHHLNSLSTEYAPTFAEIFPEVAKRLNNNTVVAHGAFHTDKACLEQAIKLSNIDDSLNINWKCTQQICDCKLDIACKVCEIDIDHHNALSDAIACGQLYNKFLKRELPHDELIKAKIEDKESGHHNSRNFPIQLSGDILKPDYENAKNKTNPFFMKKVVISGFSDTDKVRIANELKELGADIDGTVGNLTNFLIIGDNVGPSKLTRVQKNIADGKEAMIIDIGKYNEMK